MVTKPYARNVAILVVLILALGVRVMAANKWHRDTVASGKLLRLGDSDSYWILAGHVARGQPYQYGSPDASLFRAPVYPIALAPFTLFSDPTTGIYWARIMGCVCGTLSVWLVMRLTSQLLATNHNSSWLPEIFAGVLASIYPGAIGMSIVILSEAIFCPLMLLTLLGWQRSMNSTTLQTFPAIGAGVASGLAILARPSWLLFMPFAGLIVLAFHPRRTHQFKVLVLMAIGCATIMSPWWIRNWQITSRFVPTTLQVGASLYDGLHAGASGASDENMEFVDRFIESQREADRDLGLTQPADNKSLRQHSTFEYRLNASMQSAASDWARKNISGAIELALVKFARTWSIWPGAGQIGSSGLKIALTVGCFGTLILAAWASWKLSRAAHGSFGQSNTSWSIALCWLPAVYFTLLHMVFVGSIRYREPAVLVLTALAGCALVSRQWTGQAAMRERSGKD